VSSVLSSPWGAHVSAISFTHSLHILSSSPGQAVVWLPLLLAAFPSPSVHIISHWFCQSSILTD
jgi:hypothetical protein